VPTRDTKKSAMDAARFRHSPMCNRACHQRGRYAANAAAAPG
jgi:hypothetical protein